MQLEQTISAEISGNEKLKKCQKNNVEKLIFRDEFKIGHEAHFGQVPKIICGILERR